MQLIDQHTKAIMEACKQRARDAGLRFQDDTLEYVVTNRDMVDLSPRHMIPTLYDYWVHDVELLREKGQYELYPNNPYETVINSRPALSFYNDNNPDWLNVMIFYHVLAHIDFFQNNLYFKHTWGDDFVGKALADKRLLSRLRSEHGRWVDYIIEFARGVDNLVGYYAQLDDMRCGSRNQPLSRLDYYFDIFLQQEKKVPSHDYLREIDRYNQTRRDAEEGFGEDAFFADILARYPEFESKLNKHRKKFSQPPPEDVLQFLLANSAFLNSGENRWMKSVVEVVRSTSLYFQPQIRTKIINEGWASYWHETLFLQDERICGHEVDFAAIHAKVTGLSRVGLNPYAIGMRLVKEVRARASQGRLDYAFTRLTDREARRSYDTKAGDGVATLFQLREEFCDFTLINTFCDQDFVDRHKLFVAGKRLNPQRRTWEYYVRSRKADDYKQMLIDQLYHPPHIEIAGVDEKRNELVLQHRFEGKQLVREYIANTMIGLAYLWGGPVQLATTRLSSDGTSQRIIFRMDNHENTLSESVA